jgi:hypothetical protein
VVKELLKYNTEKGIIRVQRICVNLTYSGLYEGITTQNVINNLEFQGQPFSKAPIPTLFLGITDYSELAETYCIWVLLEAEPIDSKRVISSLAVCRLSNTWDDLEGQIRNLLTQIDYWRHCQDFDL